MNHTRRLGNDRTLAEREGGGHEADKNTYMYTLQKPNRKQREKEETNGEERETDEGTA